MWVLLPSLLQHIPKHNCGPDTVLGRDIGRENRHSLCFHEAESLAKENFNSQIITPNCKWDPREYMFARGIWPTGEGIFPWESDDWATKFCGIKRNCLDEGRGWVRHFNPREAHSRREHFVSQQQEILTRARGQRSEWCEKKLRK